jgi:eukaryotic-like serine/threonine-protein kinase
MPVVAGLVWTLAVTIDTSWLEAQFPDLTLFQPIGKGGQKEVFRAQTFAGNPVVVKVFHFGSNEDRALREIRAVVDLASPRVPGVLGFGKAPSPVGELVWVKEELVEGESLRQRLTRGPLSVAEAMMMARDLLEVLVLAERAHIVHRDVKPENILLATGGGAYLLDFGLARHLDLPSVTASTQLIGPNTPGYAPPEQFHNRKREIDSRADMFGLGVTLHEALTGTNPFLDGAATVVEVIHRVEHDALPPLPLSAAAPDELQQLIAAMTQRRPGHRPRTLAECRSWLKDAFQKLGLSWT